MKKIKAFSLPNKQRNFKATVSVFVIAIFGLMSLFLLQTSVTMQDRNQELKEKAEHVTGTPQYQIFDIGVVQMGDTASQGFGVSTGGVAVGRSFRTGGTQAFSWTLGGGIVGLPNLAGRGFAVANSANDSGTVVGTGATTAFGSGRLPLVWQNGAVSQLPLPGGETLGDANDVNASGVTVGSVNAGSSQRGVIYNGGSASVITQTTTNGSFFLTAFGINDSGRIVGQGIDPTNAARNVGIVYDMGAGSAIEVGALPGFNGALAFGVSNTGFVTGASMMNQGSGLPYVWSNAGGIVPVPLPAGTSQGSGRAVNSAGWVVGNASSAFSIPFLWDGTTTYRLQDIIPPNSGWDLSMNTSSSALGISDNNIIVGTGVFNGATRAYALVPVGPAPTPTPTPVASPTPTPVATPTPSPTSTPTPTPTPVASPTPTPTPSPSNVCTPSATVSEGDLAPGGIVSFGVTTGPGTVTVDHVNAGSGLQSLTVVGAPNNAVVNIPAFAPGTTAPVVVIFTAPNPGQAVDFTLRAASTFHAAFIRVRCMETCTPTTTVSEGDLFPGGIVSFGVSSGPGTVTVDHVNAGTGLQSLTVVGAPVNAVVNTPAIAPGTTAPVVVAFTPINPALPVSFRLRAASSFHAAFIDVRCGTVMNLCTQFRGIMTGSQEVPANNSTATGSGTVLLNAEETMITVNVSFAGLTVPATAGHIHGPATPGVNAPILFPFAGVPNAISGTVPQQTFAITPAQVAQLRSGLFYLNVHNATFPGGEIRGQLLCFNSP